MPKKRHHFVPRFYLRAWAHKDKVYCLQNGEIRSSNIGNVAAENYFYRLEELSPGDVEFLREAIIRDSPGRLKASHEQLLRAFAAAYQAKRQLEASNRLTAEANAEIDRLIVELNENFHTHIETDFQRHLASMISGSLDFLEEPGEAALFYRGLMVQYARTNHVKQTRRVMDPERLRLYLRVANPLAHMVALNVGLSLYAERKRHRIILLDNATDLPLITADQPVINTASNPKDTAPPAEFELYYPLSPTKAMLLVEPSGSFLPRDSSVPETFVRLYNLRIAPFLPPGVRQFTGCSRICQERVACLPELLSREADVPVIKIGHSSVLNTIPVCHSNAAAHSLAPRSRTPRCELRAP